MGGRGERAKGRLRDWEKERLGDREKAEKIKDKSSPCEMRSNFASKIISRGKKIKVKK